MTGFDFDPMGNLMAAIDLEGICLISQVNTDSYSFHLKIGDDSSKTFG